MCRTWLSQDVVQYFWPFLMLPGCMAVQGSLPFSQVQALATEEMLDSFIANK
jgi:hypothetical protein